jgi:hypothetical protein
MNVRKIGLRVDEEAEVQASIVRRMTARAKQADSNGGGTC